MKWKSVASILFSFSIHLFYYLCWWSVVRHLTRAMASCLAKCLNWLSQAFPSCWYSFFYILYNRLKADRRRLRFAFIWLEALLPSGLMSPVRIYWELKAWKWQKRQSCSLESKWSPRRGVSLRGRWIGWNDTPGRNRDSLQDPGRESDRSTGTDAWRRTAAPASGTDVTASGNCRGSAGGWRTGRPRMPNQLQRPGGSNKAAAGVMGKGRAGSPWLPHGSSCKCRRPGRRGEATSSPDAGVCLSSGGFETRPGAETRRVKY